MDRLQSLVFLHQKTMTITQRIMPMSFQPVGHCKQLLFNDRRRDRSFIV